MTDVVILSGSKAENVPSGYKRLPYAASDITDVGEGGRDDQKLFCFFLFILNESLSVNNAMERIINLVNCTELAIKF